MDTTQDRSGLGRQIFKNRPGTFGQGVYPLAEPITLGKLSLAEPEPGRCMVMWDYNPVLLTFTQFKILYWMVTQAGLNQPYRRLYDFVHGEGFLAGKGENGYWVNVRAHIKKIRQRFCDVDPAFGELHNLRGFGYRWGPLAARPQPGSKEAEGSIVQGELEVYPAVGWVFWQDKPVELTPIQVRIVVVLASERGGIVPYRNINDVVHGEEFSAGDGENGYWVNVRSHIKRIRKRFCVIDEAFEEIKTYPKKGYGLG